MFQTSSAILHQFVKENWSNIVETNMADVNNEGHPLDTVLSIFEEAFDHPESYLKPPASLHKNTLIAIKQIFDFCKKDELRGKRSATSTCPLQELLVENFDDEQIWQEIELQLGRPGSASSTITASVLLANLSAGRSCISSKWLAACLQHALNICSESPSKPISRKTSSAGAAQNSQLAAAAKSAGTAGSSTSQSIAASLATLMTAQSAEATQLLQTAI